MNKIRRKAIEDLVTKMSALKGELEKIQDEEQDVFDNMPENLQSSEKGMNSEEAIDLMGETVESMENAISSLEEII